MIMNETKSCSLPISHPEVFSKTDEFEKNENISDLSSFENVFCVSSSQSVKKMVLTTNALDGVNYLQKSDFSDIVIIRV